MPNPIGNASLNDLEVSDSEPYATFREAPEDENDDHRTREKTESIRRLDGDRCIVCTVNLTHPDLALSRAIRETPNVKVEPNYQTSYKGAGLLVFSADTDTPAAFERALSRDHTVADSMIVEYGTDDLVYRTRLTDAVFSIMPILGQLGVRIRKIVGTDLGWTLQAQFPSRGVFSTFHRFCTKNGVSFQVHKLSWGDKEQLEGDAKLTPSQWETLHTAYERGYFDVPRRISQTELADELGISSSAVSQRLRRIMSKLLEEQIRSTED